MRSTHSVRRRVQMVLMAIALTGCALAGTTPLPEDHFYRLPQPHPDETLDAPLVQGTVGVAPLRAEGLYHERSILYVDTRSPLEIHRYHYQYWFTTPGNLIQGHLAEALLSAGIAAKVIRHEPGAPVQGLIGGTIERFEQVTGPGLDQARVTLNLVYSDAERLHAPVLNKTYTATTPIAGQGMGGAVSAFGTALNHIYNDFFHDLAVSLKESHS